MGTRSLYGLAQQALPHGLSHRLECKHLLRDNGMDWNEVTGIDFDGPTTKMLLDRLIDGHLTEEQESELFLNLGREKSVPSAAYLALPILMTLPDALPARTRLFALATACYIIAHTRIRVLTLPDEVKHFFSGRSRRQLASRLLKTASDVDLERSDVIGLVLALLEIMIDSSTADIVEKALW